jgi:hypothetical protein
MTKATTVSVLTTLFKLKININCTKRQTKVRKRSVIRISCPRVTAYGAKVYSVHVRRQSTRRSASSAEGRALERSHGVGHDVRAATDLSAQGKRGMGLAADPRSVPFACNLCYMRRHLTSVNCQQARIATRIVIYRGRIAIIDPRRSGCRIAIHDTRSDIVTSLLLYHIQQQRE